jgi:hypothetical protein
MNSKSHQSCEQETEGILQKKFSKNAGGLRFRYILRRERERSKRPKNTTTHSLWRPVTLVHERIHKKHPHTLPTTTYAGGGGAAKKESPLAPAISQPLLSSSAYSIIRGRMGDPP